MAIRSEDGLTDGAVLDLSPLLTTVESTVTAEFHPLADFAAFGGYEAAAVLGTGQDIAHLADGIAGSIVSYMQCRPETAELMAASDPVNADTIGSWLRATSNGPYDGALSSALREMTHLGDGGATFPGLAMPLPPQMMVGLMAWVQGRLLDALAEVSDEETLSAAGGSWMNLMMLELGIMLEPYLMEPSAPMGRHEAAGFHPFADFAGFGAAEGRILKQTGPLLEPAAGGVIALAYDYLLTRPESAPYFADAPHLAQRKKTLKAWWIRSTTQPMDDKFHAYLSRVADSHVPGGGEYPQISIPADLTIALMGWVQMRVMTALNTIAQNDEGDYVFGTLGEPRATVQVGKAWMKMLTLQLGILLKPYLPAEAAAG